MKEVLLALTLRDAVSRCGDGEIVLRSMKDSGVIRR